MNGCKTCPAYGECTVTYRGPFCAVLRRTYGLDDDPEIVTNADRIRAMSDEELADEFMRFFTAVMHTNTDDDWSFTDDFRDELLEDLRRPVKDGEK